MRDSRARIYATLYPPGHLTKAEAPQAPGQTDTLCRPVEPTLPLTGRPSPSASRLPFHPPPVFLINTRVYNIIYNLL